MMNFKEIDLQLSGINLIESGVFWNGIWGTALNSAEELQFLPWIKSMAQDAKCSLQKSKEI